MTSPFVFGAGPAWWRSVRGAAGLLGGKASPLRFGSHPSAWAISEVLGFGRRSVKPLALTLTTV